MSGKKWSDYWKRFKSHKKGKTRTSAVLKLSDIRIPPVNKQAVLLVVFLIAIAGLSYLNFRTGSYVKILEINKTNLENELGLCNNQTQNLTSNLNTCNTNLNTCSDNLSDKTKSLSDCQSQKSDLDASLSSCQSDLSTKGSLYESCMFDLSNSQTNLQNCQSNYNVCNSNYNTCNTNFDSMKTNYAKDYCCPQNITYYKVESNRVICTNSTSDTLISC